MDGHNDPDLIKFGDSCRSDIIVLLKNRIGRQELFHSHSFILKSKSTYFADRLSDPSSQTCIEIECSEVNYNHHLKLLKCLYLPADSLSDSFDSVRSALGVLQVAADLHCESVVHSCVQYLEAVPWEESEEDEILDVVSRLGPIAMPILARIQPVDLVGTKSVFISAIRFATSIDGPSPPFGDELRTSAQEQVEYMLGDDADMPLVTADNEVQLETITGLSKTFSSFERELSLIFESGMCKFTECKILQSLSDLEWMCNVLLKMGLMNDFVSKWIDISETILRVVEDENLKCMWGLKLKLVEVTSKVLDAVGYGNVILPAPHRVQLIKSWLPFIRKLKPILDLMGDKDAEFPYKMDEDMCQSIEGAMVSLVSALPSDDQADILADWMNAEQLRYPDLSEAFEVWCFRTKSAKRRLVGGLMDKVDSTTVSL
ncbi:BTB/POZ domain-containing protein At3g05675-like isoform X1 [Sesamum indicum]|uniref:BTB/POZ domain-containing protein At3g05675-like isoform X1 n=2 Tax=Sesamum indicum TaxID=4182 RepID=A0A6I9UQM9_SESIN|nr:BTB/POZ domain-containing protein At3g05675-like isoform X1 [Sesamum indicum]